MFIPFNGNLPMKSQSSITVRYGLGKLRAVSLSETEAPIASTICLWGINPKSKHLGHGLRTSIHNPAHAAVGLPISPMNQRLCSNLAIATFGQESAESSLFDYGISELAGLRHLKPPSSTKPSSAAFLNSFPHENENIEILLDAPPSMWDEGFSFQQARDFFLKEFELHGVYTKAMQKFSLRLGVSEFADNGKFNR